MKLSNRFTFVLAAGLGLAFSALVANAQLNVNVSERGTWGPFVGGTNNVVTNNGVLNSPEQVSTGLPSLNPFTINFNPILGPSVVTLGSGTLDVASFLWHSPSPIGPTQTFTSATFKLDIDFDNDGTFDLTQNYTFSLTPFTTPSGFTGLAYSIVPINFFGSTTINGDQYAYASAVANATGALFNGQSTLSGVQFQFMLTPIPEPSTYALMGVLALGVMVYVRRRFQGPAAALS